MLREQSWHAQRTELGGSGNSLRRLRGVIHSLREQSWHAQRTELACSENRVGMLREQSWHAQRIELACSENRVGRLRGDLKFLLNACFPAYH